MKKLFSHSIKNSKKCHQFYKGYVKFKKSKNSIAIPGFVSDGINTADSIESIAGLFNNFFTSIKSASVATENESEVYIKDIFKELKENNLLKFFAF